MFFFSSLMDLLRVLVVGVLAYTGLIVLQRVTGKRTLSKMNAFDLVVTVALGSALATVLLSRDITLLEGLLGFAVLMGLQFAVTWLSIRNKAVLRTVKSEPRLLFYKGNFLWDVMRVERVAKEEILQAVRSSGIAALEDVEAVVLETDGSFSVVKPLKGKSPSALENLNLPD